MSKSSEFSEQDWALVRKEYEVLRDLARKRCATPEEFKVVEKAYDFASAAHKNVRRRSGEPYIIHPVEVAIILAEMGMDESTIIGGLLHDVIEDTDYTPEQLVADFNKEILVLVDVFVME